MPNWTYNKFYFNNKEDFKLFKKVLVSKTDNGEEVDFNNLIPMPKSLDMPAGTVTDVSIMCYLTNKLETPYDDLDVDKKALFVQLISPLPDADNISQEIIDRVNNFNETKDNLYELGKQYVKNYQNYGHTTWYDWCWKNWGVKWNASESFIGDKMISFNTPWSEPLPIIIKLVHDYPQINFVLSVEYEDILGYPPKVFIYRDKELKLFQLVFPEKGSELYKKYLEEDSIYCFDDETEAFNPDSYFFDMFEKGQKEGFKGLEWTEVGSEIIE